MNIAKINSGSPLHRENRENFSKKDPCQGKHKEFGNFAKTQGVLFTQVVHSLILDVQHIAIICVKVSFAL